MEGSRALTRRNQANTTLDFLQSQLNGCSASIQSSSLPCCGEETWKPKKPRPGEHCQVLINGLTAEVQFWRARTQMDSPLSQRHFIAAGLKVTCPDVVLRSLRR